ncbi:MAG: hypothetical protein ABIR29_02070, partial [Chthoniobacterales bacterium]
MHLLIVHHETEIGLALREMVQGYSAHTADCVTTDDTALEWAAQAAECHLLLTQLESDGVE